MTVIHSHGQHGPHPHDDYAEHQQPIDNEVIHAGELVAPDDVETSDLLDALKEAAASSDGAQPIFAGTFAMYAMADGGIMLVTDTPTGPLQGVNRLRMPPAAVRMVSALAGGKRGALRAFMGRGRRQLGQ